MPQFEDAKDDADGHLHQLDTATSFVQSIYDPLGVKLLLATSGRTLADACLPLVGGAIAQYLNTSLSTYWHADWLGTSRLESTTSQTVSFDAAYAPFGEQYLPSYAFDDLWTGSAFQDTAADLWDFPAREYHPIQGRFVTPDPAGLAAADPANPQSWNRYAYVAGDPTNSVDPLGLDATQYQYVNGCFYQSTGTSGLTEQTRDGQITWVQSVVWSQWQLVWCGTTPPSGSSSPTEGQLTSGGGVNTAGGGRTAANNGTNKPTVQQCLNNALKTYYAQVNAGLSALPSFHLFSIPGVGTSAIGGGITIAYELLNGASLASSLSTGGVSTLIGLGADAIWNTGSYLYKSNQVFDAARANYNANIAQCK